MLSHFSFLLFLLLAAFPMLLAGCKRSSTTDRRKAPPPPVTVTVGAVHQKVITEFQEFTGRTQAVESVEVRPRVSGHIEEVKFQSGQMVRKGDLLFLIDSRWYKAEVARRAAEFEQARAHLAYAGRKAALMERLASVKGVARDEEDSTRSHLVESRAATEAAESLFESARLDLEHTEVRSPIDGKISRALLTAGNYVSAASSLLTTIVSVDPIHVYADVDEAALQRLNALPRGSGASSAGKNPVPGIPVKMGFAEESGYPHTGHIESFDNRLDPNTGTILLRVSFPNPEGRIVPGLFTRIQIPTSASYQALLVEESAIGTDQAHQFVLALGASNIAEYRPVRLGPLINGKRVIRSGLKPGEQIVINGLQRVRAGMAVTPQQLQTPERPDTASR